jgi:uncharacterized membrane protein
MTEPSPLTEPLPRPATATWVKVVLALSLAINLAILGVVAGAWIKVSPDRSGGGGPRELSFGPFSEALTRQDRRALRAAFMERAPEFRAAREATRDEFEALLSALRAAPFDPAALSPVLAAIEQRNIDRLTLGRTLIEDRIIAMSEADRLAFAARLEDGLQRKGRGAP